MAEIKIDGTFTAAAQYGPTRQIIPFERDNAVYVYEADFMQFITNYAPLALNVAHPTIASAYLVKQSDPQIIGGRVAMFTRTYAKVPAQQIERETFNYRFIGLNQDGSSQGNNEQRIPFSRPVQSRVVSDFYLVGSGQTYTTADLIPLLREQEYFGASGYDYVNSLFAFSTPTKDAYIAMRTADAAAQNSYSIVAEGSFVRPWMGNIHERVTRYIKAL